MKGVVAIAALMTLCLAAYGVFPKLKEKYIDSGRVRFITREFPLDNLAAGAARAVSARHAMSAPAMREYTGLLPGA